MITRHANAEWQGDLLKGNGTFKGASGVIGGVYSFKTRFEGTPGTNPEELIAAAHSCCFSMALSAMLSEAGHVPTSVKTDAAVMMDKVGAGFKIVKIKLTTEGIVPGIDAATFKEFAEKAKAGCPISQALAAVPMELETKFG